VTITENNIVHNAGAFGIFSPRTATFPATDNFWGSPVGPFNVVNNPTGDPTNQVSSPVTPLTPFASVPFPLDFPPSPSAIPFAFPPASIATVAGTIGGTVRRAGTGTPQSGVAVILDDNGNGSLDQGEVETATDGQGNYGFTNLVGADGGTASEVVPVLPPSSTAVPARQIAILSGGEPSATIDFTLEGPTTPTTGPLSTTTTLPACDPRDCGFDICRVGYTCAGRVCQPGPPLTARQLSQFVRDDTGRAMNECGGERRRSVEKIARPLGRASDLLLQAGDARREKTVRKKLSQARRTVRRAGKQLEKRRATLSLACGANLDVAIDRATTRLSCLP